MLKKIITLCIALPIFYMPAKLNINIEEDIHNISEIFVNEEYNNAYEDILNNKYSC